MVEPDRVDILTERLIALGAALSLALALAACGGDDEAGDVAPV